MKLEVLDNGWRLALESGLVNLIQIDFRLGLFISDDTGKVNIIIETLCHLKGATGVVSLEPEKSLSLAPILPFHCAKVHRMDIENTGKLRVEFGQGEVLEVAPHPQYEAWHLGCSLGFQMICAPGGKVAIFGHFKVV